MADDGSVVGLDSDYATLRKDGKDDAISFSPPSQAVLNAVGAAVATNATMQIHTDDGHEPLPCYVKPSGHPVYSNSRSRR